MRLACQGHLARAAGCEPAGEPRVSRCPPDAEPDTVLSSLTQQLGEVIETPCTPNEHHRRLGIGWIFPDTPATGPQEAAELACMPFIESPGGLLQFMDEVQAERCAQFAQLADGHGQNIPRNTISRLLALLIRECSAFGGKVMMPTAVDLNFGSRGTSYRAANWHVYLDGQFCTHRQLIRLCGSDNPGGLADFLVAIFQMNDPLQHDTMVFVAATDRSLRHSLRKVSPRPWSANRLRK